MPKPYSENPIGAALSAPEWEEPSAEENSQEESSPGLPVPVLGLGKTRFSGDPKLKLLVTQLLLSAALLTALLVGKSIGGTVGETVRWGYEGYFAQREGLEQVLQRPEDSSVETAQDVSQSALEPSAQSQSARPTDSAATDPSTDASATTASATQGQVSAAVYGETIPTGTDNQDESSVGTMAARLDWMAMNLPVSGRISSLFGERDDPFTGEHSAHKGLDIAAKSGSKIKTALPGIVTAVGNDPDGYGNYIVVSHTGGLSTLYGHCSEICKEKGDEVTKETVIALVGSTGRSTGPHLHFEVRFNGVRLNPLWLL